MTWSQQDYRPYEGLFVLDVAQGIAGPHCTMLLAQHGATVVKIEPFAGDWGRTLGKSYGDLSAHGVAFNRGKRSIALDLKSPDGLKIAKILAARANVVAESFRPGVMDRLGLSYGQVRALVPSVVYVSVSGFGQKGPNVHLPVTDSIIQAFSGFMTINADENGVPRRLGMIAIDVLTGLYAFQAVSAALYRQAMHKKGVYLDVNMMQAAAAFQAANIMEYHLEQGVPLTLYVPMGTMKTADSFIQITAMRDQHFDAMCEVLGRPEWGKDPRYATRQKRLENEKEVMGMLRERFLTNTTEHWARALTLAGVMNAPIGTYGTFLDDAHVKAVGAFNWVDHPDLGRAPIANIPGVPPPYVAGPGVRAPHVGEHTREILHELGYRDPDIADLAAQRAILLRDPTPGPV